MSELKLFDFEGHNVRIKDLDGNPWFVLEDVCSALDITQPASAVRGLDEDEVSKVRNPHITSAGGNPNITVVNESGIYSLILRSRKPEAKRFRKWVTSEVLPSIRKTGGYVVARSEDTPEIVMARGLLAANEAIERLKLEKAAAEAKLEEYQPKVDAFLQIADADGLITFRKAAGA